jgi:hypothetical protein
MWRRKHCNLSKKFVCLERRFYFKLLFTIFFFPLTTALMHEMEKHCNAEISAMVSHLPSSKNGTSNILLVPF